MILDVEGAGSQRLARAPWVMLSLASAAVAAALHLGVNAVPHEQLARVLPATGPSILAQAFAQPAPPRLALDLPPEVAVPIPPGRVVVGDYGPGRPAPTVRAYRLRGSNDTVVVALAADAQPVSAPARRTPDALAVHGSYAIAWTIEPSINVVRWTVQGLTYEISSRTVQARELARIAEQLR
ncbi:MAG TPA: hypothetical protein VKE23_11850 [Candidatus Limnocylindria bacterium]|nr:hypothetical protein [Candidatus Limnocylindria bacterium]